MLVCQCWLASLPLALRTATTVKFLLKQGRYCKQTFDGSCIGIDKFVLQLHRDA